MTNEIPGYLKQYTIYSKDEKVPNYLQGYTQFHLCVKRGSLEEVKEMIADGKGKLFHQEGNVPITEPARASGDTILATAFKTNNLEKFSLILDELARLCDDKKIEEHQLFDYIIKCKNSGNNKNIIEQAFSKFKKGGEEALILMHEKLPIKYYIKAHVNSLIKREQREKDRKIKDITPKKKKTGWEVHLTQA